VHRVFLQIGPLTIYCYGVAVATAFLVGIWLTARRGPAFGYSRETVNDSTIPVLVSVLVGAKLAYLLIHSNEVSFGWREIVSLIRGGFVFYGGLIGGVAGGVWWLKSRGLPILPFGDLIAAPLCFGHAIGRLGCWLNGCCYGRPASWGIVMPDVDILPRVPTQLIEAAGLAVLGSLLLLARPDRARAGRTLAFYAIGYGILRFAVELLRDDPRGGAWFGMSVSQSLSIAALIAGILLLARARPASR